MKRTCKWHKLLTIKELNHLREQGVTSLAMFNLMREAQHAMKVDMVAQNGGEEAGSLTEPCWDCRNIERKLKAGGVL